MSKAMDLNKQNFDQEVLQADLPVLVDFWAPWCQPCQMMAPILDQLAEEMVDKLKICKLDISNPDNQELADKYEVQGIPNLKLFKNGQAIKEFVGLKPKDSLQQEIETEI